MKDRSDRNWAQLAGWLRRIMRWLTPGLGVKRWLIPVLIGTSLIGLGLAVLALDVYRTAPETWWLPLLSAVSLRTIERPLRAVIFGGLGLSLIFWGLWGFNRSITAPYRRLGMKLVDDLGDHRRRERGPRMVVMGGGHGLANLLRGAKKFTYNITAVVTVADDGGSSGELRRTLGILPPGDVRNCLAALSNDEALLGQLFQYRFGGADSRLDGHSFGNLFISALAEITGSFETAVVEAGRVLAVHGRVLPATLSDVKLLADITLPQVGSEVRVEGESTIPTVSGRIRRVWLDPGTPAAYPGVIQAILAADLVILGPGSLYTSILPNILVPDIAAALRASRAMKIYVCNVATQKGETEGYSCGDHLRALEDHLDSNIFDAILVNNRCDCLLPEGIKWVEAEPDLDVDHRIHRADLVDTEFPWRHDSQKLAQVILEMFQERTGPMVE
jgi:uncharacterized cofD-like protein